MKTVPNDKEIGERVKLKCGGPWMIVDSVDGLNVSCVWFDADDHLQSDTFDHRSLNKGDEHSE